MLASVLTVIVVSAATFWIVWRTAMNRVETRWRTSICQANEAPEPSKAEGLLADAKKRELWFVGQPWFKDVEIEVTSRRNQWEQARKQCAALLSKLNEIRESGFVEPHAKLEEQAAKVAVTRAEEAALVDWRLARDVHVDRLQQERDQEFGKHAGPLKQLVQRLSRLAPEKEANAYRESLDAAWKKAEEALAVTGVSQHRQTEIPVIVKQLEAFEQAFGKAKGELDRQRDLQKSLRVGQVSLAEYKEVLRAYSEGFPQGPEAQAIQKVLANWRLAEDLMQANGWSTTIDGQMKQKLEAFLNANDARNSLWRDTAQWLQAQEAVAEKAPRVAESIQVLAETPVYHDLCHVKGADPETGRTGTYYFMEEAVRETNKAPVRRTGQQNQSIRYIIRTFAKDNSLTHSFVDVTAPIPDDPSLLLAPHCVWLGDAVRDIRRQESARLGELLVAKAEELRTHPQIEPVVKVIVMSSLLEGTKDLLGQVHGIDDLLARLGEVNTNVAWMTPDPDLAARRAKGEGERVLEQMTDILEVALRAQHQRKIHRACVTRAPRFAGHVAWDSDSAFIQVRSSSVPELWIVVQNGEGLPTVLVAAERGDDGKLHVNAKCKGLLYPGQPVFAPGDGVSTAEAIEQILKDVPPEQSRQITESLHWPACWPINARKIPGK